MPHSMHRGALRVRMPTFIPRPQTRHGITFKSCDHFLGICMPDAVSDAMELLYTYSGVCKTLLPSTCFVTMPPGVRRVLTPAELS